MKNVRVRNISLLWRILLSTSMVAAALFALTGYTVQSYARRATERSLEGEVRTSLQAYRAVWSARTQTLASVSRVVSSMSDVRAAFMTGDRATIQDTAGQLWSQISEDDASFLVLDPAGKVIASLGGEYPDLTITGSDLRSAEARFPNQVAGYLARGQSLYYIVLTPVYVQATADQGLLDILLFAFHIKNGLAAELKQFTHGSDFAFTSPAGLIASTLPVSGVHDLEGGRPLQNGVRRLLIRGEDYLSLSKDLLDINNRPVGRLFIVRSFLAPQIALSQLQRNISLIWLGAIGLALLLTYLLARRILGPIKRLDFAAGQVIQRRYEHRVVVETNDELGRLAESFNTMCDSICAAREESIQHERIATIGRMSTSIVHDLRNPLAAIYGGAEMLVDAELSPEQSRRLALNIYNASGRIRKLLQDLTQVASKRPGEPEVCDLREIIRGALDAVLRDAELQSVRVETSLPDPLEVTVERERVERVFGNLFNNALEAMLEGGQLLVSTRKEDGCALACVQDTGPGISAKAWPTLFQPFSSHGKRNGIGLGLALSRQTIVEQGGALWADAKHAAGARFWLRLPLAPPSATVVSGEGGTRSSNASKPVSGGLG